MPMIAGVVEPPFSVRYSTKGVSDVASANGLTILALHHQIVNPVASQLLDEYGRGGVAAIHERNTDCAVVVIDEPGRRLLLSRDRIGLQPLYHQRTREAFAFGTTIGSARIQTHGPNRQALAALLVHGSAAPRGETYFTGVGSVWPGETLVVGSDGERILPAAPRIADDCQPTSFAQAGSRFADRFMQSVQCRVADAQTAVLVSGGLDSAAIISAADDARVVGITYGLTDGSPADESKYIDALRRAGHRIERVAFGPVADMPSLERNIRAVETPFADDVPATLERAAARARELGCNILLIGTWGDQLLAPFPPAHLQSIAPYRLSKLWHVARSFQSWMRDVPTSRIFRALLRQSLRARMPKHALHVLRRRRATHTIFDELARDFPAHVYRAPAQSYAEALRANVSAADQVEAIEGTTKWGVAQELEVRLPFLDAGLLDFLATVPDRFVYHDNQLKPLMRYGMAGRLPHEIAERRDKGDYTDAIRTNGIAIGTHLEQLDDLRRFVKFGLMSERQARVTLAQLTDSSKISAERADVAASLLSVDTWLRIFFEAQ